MDKDPPDSMLAAGTGISIGRTAAIAATGALAGVGLIAAAPVFGAVGVVTGLGALVGGLSGAAVGGGVAYATDDSEQQARVAAEAANAVKSQYAAKLDAMAKRYAELKRSHEEQLAHTDVCLALYGVAVACLKQCNAGGDENLVAQLREYVFGAAYASLPWHIQLELSLIDPPNLATAHARAHQVAPQAADLVSAVVDLVAALADPDGKSGLVSRWTQLRAA